MNDKHLGWNVAMHLDGFANFYGHTISCDTIATLLAENPEAAKRFLEKLATATAKRVGNNHPLVITLETLVGTQFPPPITPEGPVGKTGLPSPHTKAGVSDGPWID